MGGTLARVLRASGGGSGMSRPRVGFAMTAAARKRYAEEASVRRLEDVADVVWLDLEGPDRVFGPPPEDAAAVARLTDFVPDLDVLVVGYGSPRVTESVLAAAPRLQMVGDTHGDRFAARVDVAACEARRITVVDTTNGSSDPVAEWALALTLIGLRNAGSLFRRLIAGEVLWQDRDGPADRPRLPQRRADRQDRRAHRARATSDAGCSSCSHRSTCTCSRTTPAHRRCSPTPTTST